MPQHKTEWPDAERVNHISPASVAGYKPFERYLETVQFLFDRTEKIVGWNVNFDLGFLENEGVVIPQTTKVVDAMEAFGRAYGPFSETHTRWRLTSAADAVGYSFEGTPHTALADALATRYLYRHAESIIEAIDIRGQMSNAPELTDISRKLSPCGTKPVCTGAYMAKTVFGAARACGPNAHRRKEVPAMPGENEEAMRVLLMLGQAVMPPAREVLILTMRALARGTGKGCGTAGRTAQRGANHAISHVNGLGRYGLVTEHTLRRDRNDVIKLVNLGKEGALDRSDLSLLSDICRRHRIGSRFSKTRRPAISQSNTR